MGRAKRVRTVVIGASVAALGTAGACPAANAASANPTGTHAPRAVVSRKHARRHHSSRPKVSRGPYVYEVGAEGEVSVNDANVVCSGDTIRLVGVALSSEGPDEQAVKPPAVARDSFELWLRNPAAWERPNTITTGPQTAITASWTPPAERREAEKESAANNGEIRNPRLTGQQDTTTASSVCEATAPSAGVASIGRATVTWRLPAPVDSLAGLLAHAPASVVLSQYVASFEILPDGTVPSFAPFQSTQA